MSAPPLKTAISDTYPNPSNATARAGFAALYDYVTSLPFGQCRLVKSGANLVLQRYNGLWLTINDVVCMIPSGGVSLVASGLSVGTLYYIYAYMSGATMTLEASTTAHATDSTTGVEIKSGDATRTLVGMARPITGPAFADTDTQRFVISWFNRRPRRILLAAGSAVVNGNTTPVALLGNMEYLAWGDSSVEVQFVGGVSNNTTNAICATALSFDSTSAYAHATVPYQAYAVNTNGACSGGSTFSPSEGYHLHSLLGNVSGGVGTWASGLEMSGTIQG